MSNFKLLDSYEHQFEHARENASRRKPRKRPIIPKPSLSELDGEERLIRTPNELAALKEDLLAQPVHMTSFDFEYTHRNTHPLKKNRVWNDITSVKLLVLAMSFLMESLDGKAALLSVAIDLTSDISPEQLQWLFQFNCPSVGHYVKVDLFCLWALGLREPANVKDTWVVKRLQTLGFKVRKYKGDSAPLDLEDEEAEQEIEDEDSELNLSASLIDLAREYDIKHAYASSKARIQSEFLGLEGSPTDEQMRYAAADASVTLQLFLAQRQDPASARLTTYLETVEFPFIVVLARIAWNGVKLDQDRLEIVREHALKKMENLSDECLAHGVDPAHPETIRDLVRREGWTAYFKSTKPDTQTDVSLTQENLKKANHLHPVFALVMRYNDSKKIAHSEWVRGKLVSADGRHRADFNQLGTVTGRIQARDMNILGLPGAYRGIVIPDDEYRILSFDYSQIEVGIAAAEAGDTALIRAFNESDVYVMMARVVFQDLLTEEQQALSDADFKVDAETKQYRARIKILVLALLYGMGDETLARELTMGLREAAAMRARFEASFPQVVDHLIYQAELSVVRCFASMPLGVWRHAPRNKNAAAARRSLRNTPIQGGGSVLFKTMLIRLDRWARALDVRLIIPVHDAITLEVPVGSEERAKQEVREIMYHSLREHYPELQPRIDVDDADTSCWNKDGDTEVFQTFAQTD